MPETGSMVHLTASLPPHDRFFEVPKRCVVAHPHTCATLHKWVAGARAAPTVPVVLFSRSSNIYFRSHAFVTGVSPPPPSSFNLSHGHVSPVVSSNRPSRINLNW